MKSYKSIFSNINKVLIVVAHPDDAAVYFGGLIARLRNDGKEVHVLLSTNGENGGKASNNFSDLGTLRILEEIKALEHLGIDRTKLIPLNYLDGFLKAEESKLLEDIVQNIRKFKPEIVCTHSPNVIYSFSKKLDGYFVNHQDHRAVGKAVVDALYPYARNPTFFKNQNTASLTPHTVKQLIVTYDQIQNPNAKINITKVIDLKRKALMEYSSQFSQHDVEQIIEEENKEGDRYFEYYEFINLLI